jgi:phosphoenolpyruvate carboxykinase (GTP)
MLIPPATMPGWKVFTVGDDICWMQPGPDGRLWAINPEPVTSAWRRAPARRPTKNAYDMIRHDTIFTNVAVTADNEPWWEGIGGGTPVTDWQGRPYDAKNGPAAHPNSRFTVRRVQCPSIYQGSREPEGRAHLGHHLRRSPPRSRRWCTKPATGQHGVLVGASMASETTAAATGAVGVVRRDPMAMKPFCGYNFGRLLRSTG